MGTAGQQPGLGTTFPVQAREEPLRASIFLLSVVSQPRAQRSLLCTAISHHEGNAFPRPLGNKDTENAEKGVLFQHHKAPQECLR